MSRTQEQTVKQNKRLLRHHLQGSPKVYLGCAMPALLLFARITKQAAVTLTELPELMDTAISVSEHVSGKVGMPPGGRLSADE